MKTRLAQLTMACGVLFGALSHGDELNDGTGLTERPTYRVVTLSSRGGPTNSGNSINEEALIAGYTDAPDGASRHAALWFHGFRSDLGTLGGPNSNVAWPVKNRIGLIAGIAQTDIVEPLGQTWSCRSFFAFPTRSGFICSAVAWENGEIRALPTLGGYNGFATGANNRRQIVGWAQNTVLDPSCNPVHVKQQFHAVRWGPGENQVSELLPLHGDTTSAATAINDEEQVVGISGDCGTAVGGTSAREAVMWEGGKTRVLGNLGGIAWNTPMALNERGDVVGFSNIRKEDGATPNWRAFIWTKERGIRNLGALDGYPLSQALGINEKRQVVGTSCTSDFSACRAVIWIHGKIIDLNDLAPGYADVLYAANDINDDGDIAGQAFTPGTEQFSAVLAIRKRQPRTDGDIDGKAIASADIAYADASRSRQAPLPAAVRQALLQQFGLEE
jgi:probable HAF family extracellular repeat protein